MGTITLPNFRVSGTDRARVRLKDGGVYVEWSTMTDIKAWLYSVEQKAISGRFDVRVDPQDGTRLVCVYSAQKPQYLGVNKLILQCKYEGADKAYDKPLWNFVRWTADQAGEQITIDDPDIDVEIEVEDVSSSILDEAILAALAAADEANEAAVLAEEKAADAQAAAEQAAEDHARAEGDHTRAGEDHTQAATDHSTAASDHTRAGADHDTAAADHTTAAADHEASAEATEEAREAAESVGDAADRAIAAAEAAEHMVDIKRGPGIISVEVSVDGTSGTPSAESTLENEELSIEFSGLKGKDGVGLDSADTPITPDGTVILTLSDGNTVTLNLSHDHPAYPKYSVCTQEEYDAIVTKDSDKLYLIPEV